ncbi:2-oxoglutarate dehydrogenase, E2 component, dihydrolipoamide succinyltransferase [Kribbella sp. NBC_01510]|uniref:2-oxoglutarate dehydrogenase, E2 component, dihydrolipoamide succinyltransferase n=1 Tax=Kribbella sp. NBC_01510 TaxID=2903581 RepID=UPI00386A1115
MPTSVSLPALGESVTEGTVTRWLKQVGDTVAVDEPLLEVSTDKVDTEIPSPVAGTLLEIKAAEDETVEVGAELALIGDAGESSAPAQDAPAEQPAAAQAAPAQEAPAAEAAPAQEAPAAQAAPAQQAPAQEAPAAEAQAAPANSAPAPADQAPSDSPSAPASGGTSVTLPALGESVTEGTVTRWLKQVGDDVAVDEPLLEVSTDKVDTEIPSPIAGKLLEIKVAEDETVEVGAELAIVGTADAAPAASSAPSAPAASAPAEAQPAAQTPAPQAAPVQAAPAPQAAPAQAPAAQAPAAQAPAAQAAPAQAAPAASAQPATQAPSTSTPPAASPNGSPSDAPNYVTPLVRKLAAEHQVDLNAVQGTGVGGRIRKQDVIAAAEAKRAAAAAPAAAAPAAAAPAAKAPSISPLRGTTEKMSRIRKAIASHMVNSLKVSAQLTTVVEVDVTEIAKLRNAKKAEFEAREGVKLSFLPFFALAAIDALKQYPKLNASIDEEAGEITYHAAEHLGIAVDVEKGLMVPVVHNAGDLNIAGLAKKIADLAERTRTNKVLPDEMAGGTFTITNTGSRGALFDTPILNQPQVGMLGTGAVVKRPVVITHPELGETIAIRQMVFLALTYDHRLVDGADAARYLTAVKQRLEEAQFDV